MAGFKSVLKPENSVIAGIATMGAVYGIYQLNAGPVASVVMTEPNHPAVTSSRKKAGWTSVIFVAGLSLIARDANIAILGGATIIAMELSYRHAIMAHPETGQMIVPARTAYAPAENVVPIATQGSMADASGY